MELTSEQKHDISLQLNASDIYETVPFLNKVLAAIGYVDRLEDDSEREELRWTKRKEPLIKDEKIRKAVRAWAEANGVGGCICKEEIHCITFETERGMFISFEDADPIPPEGNFTIAELCGEED